MNEQSSHLSEYEKLRLDNIRRNEEFIKSLGLASTTQRKDVKHVEERLSGSSPVAQKRKARGEVIPEGTRKSPRLRGQAPETNPVDNIVEYDKLVRKTQQAPPDSDGLDDYEFEVYAKLKRWRLLLHRELDIEPFKIFHDRTFCEMVRRRRDDDNWARLSVPSGGGDDSKSINGQLLECWGIGPSKVKENGFAHQAIAVLNESEDIASLLQKSRDELQQAN